MHWITEAAYVDGYEVKLRFENDEYRIVDLEQYLDGKIFEPLKGYPK